MTYTLYPWYSPLLSFSAFCGIIVWFYIDLLGLKDLNSSCAKIVDCVLIQLVASTSSEGRNNEALLVAGYEEESKECTQPSNAQSAWH